MSSQHKGFLRQGTAAVVLLALSLPVATAAADDGCADSVAVLEKALVRLAADRIDGVLGAVADSSKAFGDAYARVAADDDQGPSNREPWLARRTTQSNTTGFRTWPAELSSPPAFQAPYPGFYSYQGEALGDALLRQLGLFERLVPTVRSIYIPEALARICHQGSRSRRLRSRPGEISGPGRLSDGGASCRARAPRIFEVPLIRALRTVIA